MDHRWLRRTLSPLVLATLFLGCSGEIGEGTRGASDNGACSADQLLEVFSDVERGGCVRGECHGPLGGAYPNLFDFESLRSLQSRDGKPMVLPGNAHGSYLYQMVSGAVPGRLMPLGAAAPDPEIELAVKRWINDGAPSACGFIPPRISGYVPQDDLFLCQDPGAERSSEARLHRLDRKEVIHSMGGFLNKDYQALDSLPFDPPTGQTTPAAWSQTIDETALALYADLLPGAMAATHGKLETLGTPFRERCLSDPDPAGDCRERFVRSLLADLVLYRSPTDSEVSTIRTLLDEEIANEGGLDKRSLTLSRMRQAAWLLPRALFRSEVGEELAEARHRLSKDELRLALTGLLTTYPATLGAAVKNPTPRTELGWLPNFEAIETDGLSDAEWREFVDQVFDIRAGYLGGVDPSRRDILGDYATHRNSGRQRYQARGDFWVTPRLLAFFQEFFDYQDFPNAFKTEPAATSRWPNVKGVNSHYAMFQVLDANNDPSYRDLLDDTIARAVVEAETNGDDVLTTLLTTRLYRLPATLISGTGVETIEGPACEGGLDCPGREQRCVPVRLNSAGAFESVCAPKDYDHQIHAARVFNQNGIVGDQEENRWVTMAESERAGVLTHPVWLGAHGANFEDDASAVFRGHWVREHLFCEDVPGLENVSLDATLAPQDELESRTARERLHLTFYGPDSDARCLGCHNLMNPIGLAFESYNHSGFLRFDDHGKAPDGSTTIINWPESETAAGMSYRSVEITDAIELSETLASDPFVRRCFLRHVFRYFLGRNETAADACTLSEMEAAFESGSLLAAIAALAKSDTFLYRHWEDS